MTDVQPAEMSAGLPSALQLPCAYGEPIGRGALRTTPEDFIVREWLGFEADGEGDHWLLTVRKRGANTHWVAKQLGKLANIHPRDVGYAGLKDRNALTEQAFTVPVRSPVAEWLGMAGDGFEVVRAQRHRRKLKRGALKGNDFEITIREFTGDRSAVAERLATIAAEGVPNYFGPQRFGHEQSNLKRAYAMFAGAGQDARMPRAHGGAGAAQRIEDRFERGFALSAARSYVFNAVLARRVATSAWNRLIAGDVANLDGSQSIFVPDAIDDVLIERCARLDIHPTGPLWGKGELQSAADVRALEGEVATGHAALCDGLARGGLEQERRPLRLRVQTLSHEWSGADLILRFRLGRGAFATTVLHEVLDDAFATVTPESDE